MNSPILKLILIISIWIFVNILWFFIWNYLNTNDKFIIMDSFISFWKYWLLLTILLIFISSWQIFFLQKKLRQEHLEIVRLESKRIINKLPESSFLTNLLSLWFSNIVIFYYLVYISNISYSTSSVLLSGLIFLIISIIIYWYIPLYNIIAYIKVNINNTDNNT